jgi:hypothetical protein
MNWRGPIISDRMTVKYSSECPGFTEGYTCYYYFFNYALQPFKAYCANWVRRSNLRHQASPRESTQRRKVELWARNVQKFCLNVDFNVTFRDFLYSVKLRHGTNDFTSLSKEGVLRIFSAGCETANLGTKDQHVTSRPPKPLGLHM